MDSAGTPPRPAGGNRPSAARPGGTPPRRPGQGSGASAPTTSAPTTAAPGTTTSRPGQAAPGTSAPTTAAPGKGDPGTAVPPPSSPAPQQPVRPPTPVATGPMPVAATAAARAATSPAPLAAGVDPRTGSGAASSTGPAATVRAPGPRRARLLLSRIDPWSVMKSAFMLSVSIAIVTLVAVALLWWSLDVTGVFAAIGRTIDDVAGSGSTSFDFLALVGFSRVMGVALVLAAVEIVLVSALSTLFAFLYNLSVGLTGGLEVTLSEDS